MAIYFKNAMEELVFQKLDALLDSIDCCKCERCRADIAAYMLNHLESKYVATTEGELFTQLLLMNTQYSVDMMTQLLRAVEVVKANPRH